MTIVDSSTRERIDNTGWPFLSIEGWIGAPDDCLDLRVDAVTDNVLDAVRPASAAGA